MKSIIPCVGFILVDEDQMLVEKRGQHKRVDPGKICVPSGGVEPGESSEDACFREVWEEFGVKAQEIQELSVLTYSHQEVDFLITYYVVCSWQGRLEKLEADELMWVPINPSYVEILPDKQAVEILLDMLK